MTTNWKVRPNTIFEKVIEHLNSMPIFNCMKCAEYVFTFLNRHMMYEKDTDILNQDSGVKFSFQSVAYRDHFVEAIAS